MSSAPTGKQRQFVYSLSEYDVLLGRGQHVKCEGNQRFISLVRSRVGEYKRADGKGNSANKDAVARQIVKDVQELGGRFVRKVEDGSVATGVSECDDVWEIADSATVLVKIKQTFRDYSVIRRKAAAATTAAATPPCAVSTTTTTYSAPVDSLGDTKPPARPEPLVHDARVESVSTATVNQLSVAHQLQLLRALEQRQQHRHMQPDGMAALGELGTVARLSMPLQANSESVVSQQPHLSPHNNPSNETRALELLRQLQSRATAPGPAAVVPSERPLEQHFYNLMQRRGHNPTSSDMPSALLLPTATTASSLYSQLNTTMQSQIRAGTASLAPVAADMPNSISSDNALRQYAINNLIQNERRQLIQQQLLLQQLNAASSTMVPSSNQLSSTAGPRDPNAQPLPPLPAMRDHVGAMTAHPNVVSQDVDAFQSQFLPTAASASRPLEPGEQERSHSNGVGSSAAELEHARKRIGR